jgi:ketosteroid isomerase-like protein
MSQADIEVVRRFYEAGERAVDAYRKNPRSGVAAFEAGNLDPEAEAVLAFLHPDLEFNALSSALYGGTVRGHHGWVAFWDELLAPTADFHVTVHDVTDFGDGQVLVAAQQSGEWTGSGIMLDVPVFGLVTLRDGLIVRIENYRERNEALEAAGLSEQDAHADS